MHQYPFFQKLGIQVHLQVEEADINIYDKGENCFIPVEGSIQVGRYKIEQGQLYSQMATKEKKFVKIQKERFLQPVIRFKVHALLQQLSDDIIKDIEYLQKLCELPFLSGYSECPILLYPYLNRVEAIPNQKLYFPNSFIFVAEGSIQGQSFVMEQGICDTFSRLYVLNKENLVHLPHFNNMLVKINEKSKKGLNQAHVDLEKNDFHRFPYLSVIKGATTIREMLKEEDQQIFQEKLRVIFGSGPQKSDLLKKKKFQSMPDVQPHIHRGKEKPVFKKKVIVVKVPKIFVERDPKPIELSNSHIISYRQTKKIVRSGKPKIQTEGNTSNIGPICNPVIKSYSMVDDSLIFADRSEVHNSVRFNTLGLRL